MGDLLDRLRTWALGRAGDGPRLLLIAGAVFDEAPVEPNLPFVERIEPDKLADLRSRLVDRRRFRDVAEPPRVR